MPTNRGFRIIMGCLARCKCIKLHVYAQTKYDTSPRYIKQLNFTISALSTLIMQKGVSKKDYFQ